MRSMAPAEMLQGGLVRLAIGFEDPSDLQADLAQALAVAQG